MKASLITKHCRDIAGTFLRRVTAECLRSATIALLLLICGGLAACHRTHAVQNLPVVQTAKSDTCDLTEEESAGLSVDPTTDVFAMPAYTATIAHMLKTAEFEKIDCLADRARSNKERFSGGGWKLHAIYQGLSEPAQYPMHPSEDDWDALLQRLRGWVASRPQSITAHVALAEAYIGYALDARGTGNANTVSESGWRIFRERTAKARQILDQASALPAKCPEWYLVMQEVALQQKWGDAERRGLFDQATRFEPEYYYYAQAVAFNLLPKWGGRPGEVDSFTREVSDSLGGERGDILYFQIAITPNLISARGDTDDPHLSLERIERGFAASEKKYGVSVVNLNRVAFLAARTLPGDFIFADDIFTRIGERRDEETWKWEDDFHMAKNASSFMGARMRLVAAADANMKTPEGIRYRAAFEKPYTEFVRACIRAGDGEFGKFMVLTRVGAEGAIEDARVEGNNPAASCLYQKLRALQESKATPFPPPPQGGYWVRLDLDWKEFTAVAAR